MTGPSCWWLKVSAVLTMLVQVAEQPAAQEDSFLQARCDKVLVTNDWCLPLVLALLVLFLLYTFLYLPSLAHHNSTV